jgi:hypothetical protein
MPVISARNGVALFMDYFVIHEFSGGGVMEYIDGMPSSQWAQQKAPPAQAG